MLKVNNKNTIEMEWKVNGNGIFIFNSKHISDSFQVNGNGIFIFNSKHISDSFLVFLLLPLKK